MWIIKIFHLCSKNVHTKRRQYIETKSLRKIKNKIGLKNYRENLGIKRRRTVQNLLESSQCRVKVSQKNAREGACIVSFENYFLQWEGNRMRVPIRCVRRRLVSLHLHPPRAWVGPSCHCSHTPPAQSFACSVHMVHLVTR